MEGAIQASQHRDLDELDCNSKIKQDMLAQLLPLWTRRIPVEVWRGLEAVKKNTQGQHPLWEPLDQEPPGVSGDLAANVWLECLESDAQDCILSIGNNTSAVGGLRNLSCFKLATQEGHIIVVRHVPLLVKKNADTYFYLRN